MITELPDTAAIRATCAEHPDDVASMVCRALCDALDAAVAQIAACRESRESWMADEFRERELRRAAEAQRDHWAENANIAAERQAVAEARIADALRELANGRRVDVIYRALAGPVE